MDLCVGVLKELEEARRQNRDIQREKFAALIQTKESIEWEKQKELEEAKEKLEKVRKLKPIYV